MAGAAVALLLLGLALAEAQTYMLDLDQPQKASCAAAQLKLQPHLKVDTLFDEHSCKTNPGLFREEWSACMPCAG